MVLYPKENMNTYFPYAVGGFIIHTLKKKNMDVPYVVNEQCTQWRVKGMCADFLGRRERVGVTEWTNGNVNKSDHWF